MGKTSSAVKDRYNAKVYDSITLRVSKGRKAELKEFAESHGESLNGFINRAIENQIRQDKETAEG